MDTLVDKLLKEQKQLQTPVARFSKSHDNEELRTDLYKHLIPLEKPNPGEQYAFQVELDKCTGCKACVVACHTLNGLDEEEAWRDVGLLEAGNGFQQTVTSACHHCLEPECMHGCPVGAYEKEPDTGIVRHLDDQCIGCEYCVLKCPYDVPKYSHDRGIVRKCDMCHQRLEAGEAPACVQACPTSAISIIKVNQAELREDNPFLPGAPSPKITLPTTRYIGREVPLHAQPAHQSRLSPQPAHWPLALMLVLTQIGLGLTTASLTGNTTLAIVGAVIFNMGMAAATFHLGKPQKAWRFFLGLKRSWLSREILAFTLIAPLPLIIAAAPFLPEISFKAPLVFVAKLSLIPAALGAIFTSVMIYHDTKRIPWDLKITTPNFFLTFTAAATLFVHPFLFMISITALAIIESFHLMPLREDLWSPARHSAQLRYGPMRSILEYRFFTLFAALLTAFISPWVALPILMCSELLSRHLFFRCVHAPKMPGGLNLSESLNHN